MKNLILFITLLLTFTFTTQAQDLGDTRSQVLNERGTPHEMKADKLVYVTEDRMVIIFTFENGVVTQYSIGVRASMSAFKSIVDNRRQEYGAPAKYGQKGNTIYVAWSLSGDAYILSFDVQEEIITILVLDRTSEGLRL